jgi:two-component system chemotaxis sensor kinase CheA
MSTIAHGLEDLLDKLRNPVETRRDETLKEMLANFEKQEALVEDIKKKMAQFFGEGEDMSVKIPLARIETLSEKSRKLAQRSGQTALDPDIRDIVGECQKLTWKQFKDVSRKYQKIVQKAARKLSKDVEFSSEPEKLLVPPDELNLIDEALVHLTRNAVDHGIESQEARIEAAKGIGHVRMVRRVIDGKKIIAISDDGAGIDAQRIAAKALEKGIITPQQAQSMSEQEKLSLIFLPGFSTAETVTEISGRGFGMDIVKKCLAAVGASVTIETRIGEGSTFTITIPADGSTGAA